MRGFSIKNLLLCFTFALSNFLYATETTGTTYLTEQAAVARGLQQTDISNQLHARRAIAEDKIQAAGRWDNPRIEYSRETLATPSGENEETTYTLSQNFNFAGVKGLERTAARLELNAEDARIELLRRDIVAEIRTLFYAALAAESRVNQLENWYQRLTQLTRAVAARAEAGDAARYDRVRLEQEVALVYGELLEARSDSASHHDHLFILINGQQVDLNGRVLPATNPPPVTPALSDTHPLIRALTAEAESAAIHSKAASRERWPEVTLGVGQREVNEPGLQADGKVISLEMEIPLFDRGSGPASAARHRKHLLLAERALAEHHILAEARAIQRQWLAQREAVTHLTAQEGSHNLIDMAELAYRAGEISVMELLDAHRTTLNVQQEMLRRSLAARQAYIHWQTLTGE